MVQKTGSLCTNAACIETVITETRERTKAVVSHTRPNVLLGITVYLGGREKIINGREPMSVPLLVNI